MNQNKRRTLTIAFLGPKGTFCEQAAKKYFAEEKALLIPFQTIKDVFKAVTEGESDCGVVPIENSLDGSVNVTLDLLLELNLMICGEVELRVVHNLIAKEGLKMSEITQVFSKAEALAQCRRFLEKNLPPQN